MSSEYLEQDDESTTSQIDGPALVMTVWLLSSVLVLCITIRIMPRLKTNNHHLLSVADDVLVVLVGLIALTSMIVMSIATNHAIGRSPELPNKIETTTYQVEQHISTTLFIVVVGLSKLPLIFWLARLNLRIAIRASFTMLGLTTVLCMFASTVAVIFQCQSLEPGDIQTWQCISVQPFWTTVIAMDIALDLILTILSVAAVISLETRQCSNTRAALVLSARTLIICPSLVRLVCIQQYSPGNTDLSFVSFPYAIATQVQSALAAILSCTLALPCLSVLLSTRISQASMTNSKLWLGSVSSIQSPLSEQITLVKEPLPIIQASMARTICSPHNSPASQLGPVYGDAKTPPRPPPPSDNEKIDLSMFTRKPTVKNSPLVTLPGNVTNLTRTHQGANTTKPSKTVKFVD